MCFFSHSVHAGYHTHMGQNTPGSRKYSRQKQYKCNLKLICHQSGSNVRLYPLPSVGLDHLSFLPTGPRLSWAKPPSPTRLDQGQPPHNQMWAHHSCPRYQIKTSGQIRSMDRPGTAPLAWLRYIVNEKEDRLKVAMEDKLVLAYSQAPNLKRGLQQVQMLAVPPHQYGPHHHVGHG